MCLSFDTSPYSYILSLLSFLHPLLLLFPDFITPVKVAKGDFNVIAAVADTVLSVPQPHLSATPSYSYPANTK